MLRLLEGACAITPLPTNNAKIEGAGKNGTKRGVMYLGANFKALSLFFFFTFFFLSLAHKNIGGGG